VPLPSVRVSNRKPAAMMRNNIRSIVSSGGNVRRYAGSCRREASPNAAIMSACKLAMVKRL
jgi:hypothetical protein